MLPAGLLRERIQIQTSTPTRAGNGEAILTWSTSSTVWAKAEILGQNENIEGEKRTATKGVKFTVRYSTTTLSLNPANQIVWQNKLYNITGVIPDDRKISIDIMAEEKQ
jgi:SPP1 family predicted phage head-tail adaptor